MATVFTTRKSQQEISPLSRHIDEWQRLSIENRNRVLGQNYLEDIEEFYMLSDSGAPTPTFRPAVRIPELQTLMLYEANDLSETSPMVYITDSQEDKLDKARNEDHEKTFQAEWRRSMANYHTMFAMLWALFGGTGFVQLGINPFSRNGRPEVWLKARDPRTAHFDGATDYTLNWSYLILEDYLYIDEIRKRWPLTSQGLKARPVTTPRNSLLGPAGTGLTMPDGPMQSVGGLPSNRIGPEDNRLRVRYCFCEDYTREKAANNDIPRGAITDASDLQWKYPNGRMIVDCEGRILSDGDNWVPLGRFPLFPFWSMPPLFGAWGLPAVRYSVTLQNVAERLTTGTFENAVRLNNGVWFIHANTGIDPEAFGGVPGEVVVINPNSTVPECKFPNPMPQQMLDLPAKLLDRQKSLQGFTQSRQGNPGAGNISTELFDESVLRAQGMTQLRGRLAAVSIQRMAETFYYTMLRYYRQTRRFSHRGESGHEIVEWSPADLEYQSRPDLMELMVDEASVQPLSQAVVKRMVPELLKNKAISLRRGLQLLQFPHASEIANEREQEMALEALARARGNRR